MQKPSVNDRTQVKAGDACKAHFNLLWMDEALHHLEAMLEAIVYWYLRWGIIRKQCFLGGEKLDFATIPLVPVPNQLPARILPRRRKASASAGAASSPHWLCLRSMSSRPRFCVLGEAPDGLGAAEGL